MAEPHTLELKHGHVHSDAVSHHLLGVKTSHKHLRCHDSSLGKGAEGHGVPSGTFSVTHRLVDPPVHTQTPLFPIHTHTQGLAHPGASILPQRAQGQGDHTGTPQIRELNGLGGGSLGQPSCKDFRG